MASPQSPAGYGGQRPPAYPSLAHTPYQHTICDIRAQILANASILVPSSIVHGEPLQVVVAKTPNGQHCAILCIQTVWGATHGSAYKNPETMRIIQAGQPRNTIPEALEFMLEQTEIKINDMAVQNAVHVAPPRGQGHRDDCVLM